MAMNGLRDWDKLDGASNFVVWKARILSIPDRHRIKAFALRIVAIPVDLDNNEKYEEAMAKAKCITLMGSRIMWSNILLRRKRKRKCGTP